MTAISISQVSRMLGKARDRWGEITFCGTAKSWEECFREQFGTVELWYNDMAGGTHMVTERQETESEEHDELCDCWDCHYSRRMARAEAAYDAELDKEQSE